MKWGEATMAVQTTRTVEEMEEYCARLRAAGLDAPRSRPGPPLPPKPTPTPPPPPRWRDIQPLLRGSSEVLRPPPGAQRPGVPPPQPRGSEPNRPPTLPL